MLKLKGGFVGNHGARSVSACKKGKSLMELSMRSPRCRIERKAVDTAREPFQASASRELHQNAPCDTGWRAATAGMIPSCSSATSARVSKTLTTILCHIGLESSTHASGAHMKTRACAKRKICDLAKRTSFPAKHLPATAPQYRGRRALPTKSQHHRLQRDIR